MTGSEKYLFCLIKQLIQVFGFHAVLVVPNEGMLSRQARAVGADIVAFSFPKTTAVWRPGPHSPAVMQSMSKDPHLNPLFNLIHQHSPDFIITNTCVNPMPAMAAKRIGIPIAWIISEVIEQTAWTPFSVQFIHRHADWIIGISQTVLRPFLKHKNMQSKCFMLHPSLEMDKWGPPESWNKINLSRRQQLNIPAEANVVGFVSADLVPHKGLDHFVDMALEVCRHYADVHFVIAGNPTDAAYCSQCFQKMRQSGYWKRFHILPFQTNLKQLYAMIDILVVPSMINEGFGMTALEGMAFGKAVVSYHSGGLAEIAALTGNKRWLCNKGNTAQLASKVLAILTRGKPFMRSFIENREKAESEFGMKRYLQRLEPFVQTIMQAWRQIEQKREQVISAWPDRVLLKGASTNVYFIENGRKRHIRDGADLLFYKFRPEQIIAVDDQMLNMFRTGREIRRDGLFQYNSPAYLLVKGSGPAVYLWENGTLSPFQSAEAFARFGGHISETVSIPDPIIFALPKGKAITVRAILERGLINHKLYLAPNGERFYAENGKLRKIVSDAVIQFYKWTNRPWIRLTQQEFQNLPRGVPLIV